MVEPNWYSSLGNMRLRVGVPEPGPGFQWRHFEYPSEFEVTNTRLFMAPQEVVSELSQEMNLLLK
jgi:hypothetical protein